MNARPSYPDLRGKHVLVTGAAQGIGLGLVSAFLDQGCEVTTIVRSKFAIDHPAAHAVTVVTADIQDLTPIADWLATHEKSGGRVDVLVNNAGSIVKKELIDTTPDEFDAVFGVNTKSTFFLSQMIARHMRTRGGGVILNNASYAVTLASIQYGAYAASKSAIVALTRSMAAEWAPFGIRVNAFSPGVIRTRMTEPALAQRHDEMMGQIALARTGTVDEVADVVLFLASDASRYMTGVNLDITGGKLIVQNPGSAWKG